MAKGYSHLTLADREVLALMIAARCTKAEIAKKMGRSKSTIYRELQRNGQADFYGPVEAHLRSVRRTCAARKACCKMNRPAMFEYVAGRLERCWSADQIAGRMRRDFPENPRFRLSGQTIHTWLLRYDHARRLVVFLRRYRRPKHRRRVSKERFRGIEGRPEVINRRDRFGDWEGDLIVGPGGAAIISLVERRSGCVELILVPDRLSKTICDAIIRRMSTYAPDLLRSITFDNGSEFARAAELTAALGVDIYYAAPRSPWQRGSNEHMNGLVRQYFPKRTSFASLSRRKLAIVQRLLNERPRKRLNYQTPAEILAQQRLRAIPT